MRKLECLCDFVSGESMLVVVFEVFVFGVCVLRMLV